MLNDAVLEPQWSCGPILPASLVDILSERTDSDASDDEGMTNMDEVRVLDYVDDDSDNEY